LAKRVARVLASQVVVDRPDFPVAEDGPCELGQRVSNDDERLFRMAQLRGAVRGGGAQRMHAFERAPRGLYCGRHGRDLATDKVDEAMASGFSPGRALTLAARWMAMPALEPSKTPLWSARS